MTEIVRWAIIGASQIARSWVAAAIKSVPSAELAALVSRDEARGKAFAREFDIPFVFSSIDELAESKKVDAVYISTANNRHKELTLQAASAKLHVLCEKPLALKLEDAIAMAEACDEANIVMATNHHMRGAATHQKIREMVKAGDIGRPLAARAMYCEYLPKDLQTWRTNDTEQGGVIFDLTVHNVDALRFILNDEPVEVTSMKASNLIGRNGVEDQAQSVIEFSSGLIAYCHESQALGHCETSLEVHGTDGSIYGRGVLDEAPSGQVFLRKGKTMQEIVVTSQNLYAATISQFNNAVLKAERPLATGWDGVRSLATALAVRQSCNTKSAVAVPRVGLT